MPKRLAGLFVPMLLAVLLLSGCGAAGASDPLIVARVNGVPITLSQYQQTLAALQAGTTQTGPLTWQTPQGRTNLSGLQTSALNYLIDIQLMRDAARAAKLTLTTKDRQAAEATVKANVDNARTQLSKQPNDTHLRTLIEANTPLIPVMAEHLALRTLLLANASVPSVQARVIVTATDQEARALQEQVERGADFGALAAKQTIAAQFATSKGDLGTVYVGEVGDAFDTQVFSPGALPANWTRKFVIVPVQTNFALFELTPHAPIALKTITNTQQQGLVFSGWLKNVLAKQARIERYITVG